MNMRWLVILLISVFWLAGCGGSGGTRREGASTGEMGDERSSYSPANTFIALATEYMRQGNMNAALNNARKAVDADSRSTNAQTVLAIVYQQLGETDLARQHFEKAIALDGKDSYALNAFGDFACRMGEYDKAMSLFERAVSNPLYDKAWIAYGNAGACAYQAGNLALAEPYFKKALAANENDLKTLEGMAGISLAQGNALSARAYVERYRALSRPSAEVLWVGAEAERALGNFDQARSYEMLLKNGFPDSAQAEKLNRRQ